MLGLRGLVVLAADEYGGELELIESTETVTGCPSCGVVATGQGRRERLVGDVPSAGRPVTPVWRKRIWCYRERLCGQRTWSETHPAKRAGGGSSRWSAPRPAA